MILDPNDAQVPPSDNGEWDNPGEGSVNGMGSDKLNDGGQSGRGAWLRRAVNHLLRQPPVFEPNAALHPLAAVGLTLAILALSLAAGAAAIQLAPLIGDDPALLPLLSLLGAQFASVVLTIAAAGIGRSKPRKALALDQVPGGAATYIVALAVLLAGVGALTLASWLIDASSLTGDLAPFKVLVDSSYWWLALIAVGVGAPLMEELLFRGLLLTSLASSRIGFIGASLLSTALWTILHAGYSVFGLAAVLLVGLYFCWLVWRTGSTRVALFCHAVYNTAIVLVLMMVDLPVPASAG